LAKKELLAEMEDRPVILNRAPVWHKYGILALKPQLVKGNSIQTSPLINAGYNLDHDGNCCVFGTMILLDIDCSVLYSGDVVYFTRLQETIMRVTGTTKIPVSGTFQVQLPIGELPPTIEAKSMPVAGKAAKIKPGQKVYPLPAGLKVLTYSHETGEVSYSPITHLTVDANHACVEVTTARGRKVEVSDNESLCCYDRNTQQMVKIAPCDAIGMLSPVVVQEPITGTEFNFELGWWYGVMVSDGWFTERTVGYSKSSEVLLGAVERIARQEISPNFSRRDYDETKKEGKFSDSKKIHMNGRGLRSLVFNMYSERTDGEEEFRSALFKKIPDEILNRGSRECLLGVLSGLLDGDSTVGWNRVLTKDRFIARLNTSSKSLVETVGVLCRKLGIRYSVTTTKAKGKSKESYSLNYSLVDIYKLVPELRFTEPSHQTDFDAFYAAGQPSDKRDIVPVPAELLEPYMRHVLKAGNTTYAGMAKGVKQGHVSRSVARTSLRAIKDAGVDMKPLLAWRRMVRNSVIHWDTIKSVAAIESQTVYDLAVPETKVFAVSNGLVIYDTMSYSIPVGDEARKEALEKMLPSRNLLSTKDMKSAMHMPSKEMAAGLYQLTSGKSDKSIRTFATRRDALNALQSGGIDPGDKINVLS
jgi:hypothetical protein